MLRAHPFGEAWWGMWRWIERHPLLFVTGLLFSPLIVIGGLNLTGFCWKEMRYVPFEEKCEAAMRYTYNIYKESPIKFFRIKGLYYKEINNLVKYKNYDDFKLSNLNYCQEAESNEGWRVSFLYCLFGYCGGYARVEFAADADGIDPIALLVRERWGVFNVAISKAINKEIRRKFNEIDEKYRNLYFKLIDSDLSFAEKQENSKKLLNNLKHDVNRMINSIKDKKIRSSVVKIYNDTKRNINLLNVVYLVLDNCGHVWNPFD